MDTATMVHLIIACGGVLTTLAGVIFGMKWAIAGLTKAVEAISVQLADHEKRLDAHSKRFARGDVQISHLTQAVDEMKAQLATLNQNLTTWMARRPDGPSRD